jgi:hypothetical protein
MDWLLTTTFLDVTDGRSSVDRSTQIGPTTLMFAGLGMNLTIRESATRHNPSSETHNSISNPMAKPACRPDPNPA